MTNCDGTAPWNFDLGNGVPCNQQFALYQTLINQQFSHSVRYLNIVVDKVHPFIAIVFPDGDGLYQQDNVPCYTARIIKEWFEENDGSPKFTQSNICGMTWKSRFAQHHHLPNVQELEDLLDDIMVPDTTEDLSPPHRINASMCVLCFVG